jgi:hypothetical protein
MPISDFAKLLPAHEIDLRSGERLPGDYAAAHVLGFAYPGGAIPSEEVLRADLQTAVKAYRALTFRGGIDPSLEQANGPISSLAEGVKVTYAVPTDFTVLCANCHRMIHRTDDPSDLAGFRVLVAGARPVAHMDD